MSYVKGKNKEQILDELKGTAEPGSVVHEQQKMGIIVRCVQDIEKAISSLELSINKNAESSKDLSKRLYWLNIILTGATVLLALASIISLIKIFR